MDADIKQPQPGDAVKVNKMGTWYHAKVLQVWQGSMTVQAYFWDKDPVLAFEHGRERSQWLWPEEAE